MNAQGKAVIHGMIIGNSESKMLVFRSEERDKNGDTVTAVEQYESLTLGIAITASEIIALPSKLLGSTIDEHLKDCDLM